MACRRGTVADQAVDARLVLDRVCALIDGDSFHRVKIRSRTQASVVADRTRLGVFAIALLLSTVAPVVGFYLGFLMIQRNLRWRLQIDLEPLGSGTILSWCLRTPLEQAEVDSMFAGVGASEQLAVALDMLAHAD